MKSVKLGYGILLLAALMLAIVSNAYHAFLLLTVVLLLPVFFLLYALYGRQCLRVKLAGEGYAYKKGEKIPLAVEIVNRGVFPIINAQISIRYTNRYLSYERDVMFVTSVLPGKTQPTKFCLTSEHCGELHAAISAVTIFDPLGLFQKKVELGHNKQDTETSVIVLPSLNEEKTTPDLSFNTVNEIEEVYSLHKSGDDPSQVFDIREYRPGDRPRQIHWKLTLKQGELMVREFSQPIFNRVTIFIDFNVKSYLKDVLSLVDNMLETALSLSCQLQRHYVQHTIAWFDLRSQDTDSININCEDDIYRAIQHLFAVPLYEGESRGKQLYPAGSLEIYRENVLYFEPGNIPNVSDGERSIV